MFELQHITSRIRKFLQRSFRLSFGDYDMYSIWSFCPMSNWNRVKAMLQSCSLCRAESFPIVFWLVVVFSLCGATFNCYELLQVWSCPCEKLAVWRQRHFYVLDHWALRKARLLSSGTIMIAWLMLIYGIIAISPPAMSPWILLTSFVLSVEWFMWSFEVITGRLPISLQTLLSLVLHVFFLGMVCCVKSVFEVALGEHFEHSLRII
ncbi:uncharacterized protein LOC6550856 [Drosophila erecta]|uniref:Uncharacterized protein n=1 Tax=Drosophila erecta TaxID=7220 RepID=B3NSP2_DROER|nr:uncharacterized protein LOC6550856 [Drosophila erecta]EDV45722.1 uncharacterized protein Dere_GG18585 [Drosophila erecta]